MGNYVHAGVPGGLAQSVGHPPQVLALGSAPQAQSLA